MCSALGVTRQGHYAWRRRPPRTRDERDLELKRLISGVYEASRRTCGAPKVHMELLRRGARLTDITYVRTRRGWLCLAYMMDIWSRRIVGRSISERMGAALADDALRMAIARRRSPAVCIHHSDHESQYVSFRLGRTMRDNGIRPSMGRSRRRGTTPRRSH